VKKGVVGRRKIGLASLLPIVDFLSSALLSKIKVS
jgi:hypothetical protein